MIMSRRDTREEEVDLIRYLVYTGKHHRIGRN